MSDQLTERALMRLDAIDTEIASLEARLAKLKRSRERIGAGGVKESWLSSDDPEKFAKAAMRCCHAGGFCMEDGYCHFGGCLLIMDVSVKMEAAARAANEAELEPA